MHFSPVVNPFNRRMSEAAKVTLAMLPMPFISTSCKVGGAALVDPSWTSWTKVSTFSKTMLVTESTSS